MIEICELTEMDLEVVAGGGGLVNVPISIQNSVQNTIPVQVAAATSLGGDANALNGIGSAGNFGFQGILGS
ncbi:hypothetical protein [Bradyrhizobium sp. UFLA05-112]|jgi:hypothetical protein